MIIQTSVLPPHCSSFLVRHSGSWSHVYIAASGKEEWSRGGTFPHPRKSSQMLRELLCLYPISQHLLNNAVPKPKGGLEICVWLKIGIFDPVEERENGSHYTYLNLRVTFFRMNIRVSFKFLCTLKANYSTVPSSTFTLYKM